MVRNAIPIGMKNFVLFDVGSRYNSFFSYIFWLTLFKTEIMKNHNSHVMLSILATKFDAGMVARTIVRIMKKNNGINPIYSEDLYVFRKILNVFIAFIS